MPHLNLALLVVALMFTAAHADDWSKSYDVGSNPQLRVHTTDANIELDTWDQNKIEARVTTQRDKIGQGGVEVARQQVAEEHERRTLVPARGCRRLEGNVGPAS